MILFIVTDFNHLDQKSYDDAINRIRNDRHNFTIAALGSDESFIFYGTYCRNFIFADDPCRYSLKIQRLLLKNTGQTIALIPVSLVPYSIYPLTVLMEIIMADDDDLSDIRDQYYLDSRSLLRIRNTFHTLWNPYFDWLSCSFEQIVFASFRLFHKQFMQTRGSAFLYSPT